MLYKSHEEANAADSRYGDIKLLIDGHHIVQLTEIFCRIKKTTIAQALGIKGDRLNNMLNRRELFRLGYIENMAVLFGVSVVRIVELIYYDAVV